MDVRHLVTKSFDKENDIRQTILLEGVPLNIPINADKITLNSDADQIGENFTEAFTEITLDLNQGNVPDSINFSKTLNKGRNTLKETPLKEILFRGNHVLPLSQLYSYRVQKNSKIAEIAPELVGVEFKYLVENELFKNKLIEITKEMFPYENVLTGRKDVDETKYYAPYVPFVVLTGVILPQLDKDDKTYLNPEGTVSVAEFLDCLNSIRYGCNANNERRKSLDNLSDNEDYFNEGYNSCLSGIRSPFFNLYTKEELLKPITRAEMAYIIVICWKKFLNKFLYGGDYDLGITFDWNAPQDYVGMFTDGFDYKVSKIVRNEEYNIISLDIKDYKDKSCMRDYMNQLKDGVKAIPMPMYMSLIELRVLGLFHFEENELAPLKEVKRGELCYLVTKLAEEFPTKYIYD